MSNEKIQWLHDAATEFASTGMKMTMNPDEVLQLTTPLLALRKERDRAEPVAIIDQANLDYLKSGADADVWPPERAEMGDMPLYTTPPAHPVAVPVVPAEMTKRRACKEYSGRIEVIEAYRNGFNACRAAMLAAPGKN